MSLGSSAEPTSAATTATSGSGADSATSTFTPMDTSSESSSSTSEAQTMTTSSTSTGPTLCDPSECASALCEGEACIWAEDCAHLLLQAPATPSGVYEIDPDGAGPIRPYDAYCDMDFDGGGWTLVMKFASGTNVLEFDSPLWSNVDTLNATPPGPNVGAQIGNAKYPTYADVTGGEIRLQWVEEIFAAEFSADLLGNETALDVFTGPQVLIVGNEAKACNGDLLVDASGYDATIMQHGRGPQFFGINGTDAGQDNTTGALRFGYASNDETFNSWIAEQAVGADGASVVWLAHTDCDALGCGCYGTGYAPTEYGANLYIR